KSRRQLNDLKQLLTATPEQLGKAGHFARLRLLDPDRFPDFDAFVEEENSYEPVARAVEVLLTDAPLDEATLDTLAGSLNETDNRPLLDSLQHSDIDTPENAAARQALVEHLLDRHGTGRVLFRNTRAAVKGFPQRQVSPCPLPVPEAYRSVLQPGDATLQLTPELAWQAAQADSSTHWTELDPRVDWLSDTLSALKPHKVLVIAANAGTVLDLAEHLRTRRGIHAAVFHEGMGLVERDRAAAFFADADYGTQVLLCSEIGSEGRNFQFAHQLILFDLPLNPDLLEQRIGRLDRIGQRATIRIHVPYLEGSAQAVLFHWYHEGLSAFEHTCPAGHTVFTQMKDKLNAALAHPEHDSSDLIEATRNAHHALNEALHCGRDKLLEYNSCRPHIANDLKQRALEEDAHSALPAYMDAVFDAFGVNSEEHSKGCQIIRPGEHMPGRFPGLPDDGMTITWDRETALVYEDTQYLSWEHPLVTGAMDLVLGNETGNTALTSIRYRGTPPGSLLLECLYILDSASSDSLQSKRYLPPTTIRVVMDEQGRDHARELGHDYLQQHREAVNADTATRVVRAREQALRDLVNVCERHAKQQVPALLDSARQRTQRTLQGEIDRLRALQQVNPNVRDEEIEYLERRQTLLTALLESATLRLDAIRVIVST
ncbi:MAG: RNA polymerase-associated protein RapA, partial [Thiogranum sp.]